MWPSLQPLWTAFYELNTERQIGMGLGPIPVSKIKSYAADDIEIVGAEAERFVGIIRAMDDEYLALMNASKERQPDREVKAGDTAGARAMLLSMASRTKQ